MSSLRRGFNDLGRDSAVHTRLSVFKDFGLRVVYELLDKVNELLINVAADADLGHNVVASNVFRHLLNELLLCIMDLVAVGGPKLAQHVHLNSQSIVAGVSYLAVRRSIQVVMTTSLQVARMTAVALARLFN